MEAVNYDIAVMGGGPGGYAAALRAAELNLKVAVIEKDKVGGTCLHRGCIPATSLLQCASVLETVNRSSKFGITVENISYDWQAVQKAKSVAVNRLFMGLNTLFKQRKVDIIKGTASLSEPGTVRVENESGLSAINAPNIIIATGSEPQTMPEFKGNPKVVLDTTRALEINEVPNSITIIGGGVYGVEFASLFRSFGSDVSIIEQAPRLIVRDDADISRYLEKAFNKRGIKILTGSTIEKVTIKENGAEIEISRNGESQVIESDKVLVTVGRKVNTSHISIEDLGIETRDGFIRTEPGMRTGADGIYAVGDVTCNPQYANFAFLEGIYAAETIAGLKPAELNLRQMPIYTFGYPEIARVGYTEEEARQVGFDIEAIGLPFQTISRSAINKEDIGYAKMISVKGGPIIGVHLIGPGVVDMISEAMLITNWEATPNDMARFLHPHPTFTEAIGETALKLAGKPLHAL